MKEEKHLKEKTALIEKELATITESLEGLSAALKDVEELKLEIKGLKLFLGRVHPEFKNQYLEIMKKIKG
ncbi:MAG: hypothetical protein M1508_11440 [Nitrospirae bacterium]|nr:hypothetical protein [Nitrospirota bacterium]MCL5422560.1 hypothetical protein [Nitrospirota bacterium]